MSDLVMIRTFEQEIIERFAAHSRVPVINGLTNEYHPCQILADIYTYIERRGSIQGKTVAWIGDSNNVCNTWLQAAEVFDFNVHVSTPPGYEVEPDRSLRTVDNLRINLLAAMGGEAVHKQSVRLRGGHHLHVHNPVRERLASNVVFAFEAHARPDIGSN